MTTTSFFLVDEAATLRAGRALAMAISQVATLQHSMVVYLQGQLGAGKTTLCRGLLQAFTHQGAVKSPTYTLVEPYDLPVGKIYHFDLYRLRDPQELEYLGVQDYFDHGYLCLVEWPERGEGLLPPADLVLKLDLSSTGRTLTLHSVSPLGEALLKNFSPLEK